MPDAAPGGRAIGRNTTRSSVNETGLVFEKHFAGEPGDAERRYRNSVAWEDVAAAHALRISPTLVERDDSRLRLVFVYLTDARSLQEALAAHPFTTPDAAVPARLTQAFADAGDVLGGVHAAPVEASSLPLTHAAPAGTDPGGRPAPHESWPLAVFDHLSPEQYAAASAAELECWRLFHHDEELRTALRDWAADPRAGDPRVPVHGDLRLDQFLDTPDGLYLVDWEEFGLGSPSRDVAGVVGSIVLEALMRTFGAPVAEEDTAAELHRSFLDRGQGLMRATAPLMSAFMSAYERRSGIRLDPHRLGRDVGWFLIERVLARAMVSGRLPTRDRAVAGVGRQALLEPEGLAGLVTARA